MNLLKIIFLSTNKKKFYLLASLGLLVGFINVFLIYLITSAIEAPMAETSNKIYYFFGTILVFLCTNLIFTRALVVMSQRGIKVTKQKIFEVAFYSNYKEIESQKDNIYSIYSDDMEILVGSYAGIIQMIVSIASVFFAFLYLAWLSLSLFATTIAVVLFGFLIYYVVIGQAIPHFKGARIVHNILIHKLFEVLNGQKELRIYLEKKAHLKEKVDENLEKSYDHNQRSHSLLVMTGIVGQTVLFGYLGLLLIGFPAFYPNDHLLLLNYSFVLLYIFNPIGEIMHLMNPLTKANVIAYKMLKLIGNADKNKKKAIPTSQANHKLFNQFKLTNLSYSYDNQSNGFELGPLDFEVNKNEVIFVYGGNGSGKTTLMLSILDFNKPKIGKIEFNNETITYKEWENKVTQYFAPIFSDFYLFEKFYDRKNIDEKRFNRYLKIFELEDKVALKDNGFSTLSLSTGQRKRLALISSLLEDRPILFLDEWAADQDPNFRKKFYTEILPWLKTEENKTIIAITHDDHYYYIADKLLKMDYGKLILKENSEALINY